MGIELDSITDAQKLYYTYSSAMGFNVQKGDIRHYKKKYNLNEKMGLF